jgi:leucyl-tRNA synthetase
MTRGPYHPHAIEAKWQRHWLDQKTFHCEIDASKPKSYVLDMFPYPSGAGLHVGHLVGYTATDVLSRYRRMLGFNVLHPMGWDSFGLPAEQYAIRTGTHPAITTQKNIDTYRRQLQRMGFSYDWQREVATSDPDYYRWTQWIFTKLFEQGLAYEAEVTVNYCPALGTVLANEEVEDGKSVEGGHLVEKRPLRQWMLRITAYAERLLADLEGLDWPDNLKKLQTNWIGRTEGAQIQFALEGSQEKVMVYTTRPDTLMGVTFLALAPEHPLLKQLTSPAQRAAVEAYCEEAGRRSEIDRTDATRSKTGVATGGHVLHPVSGAKVPVWVGDYVLASVGTGAVMGVPAHDERDFAFAQAYGLPVVCVVRPTLEQLEQEGVVEAHEGLTRIERGDDCWPGTGMMIHSNDADLKIDGMTNEAAKVAVVSWLQDHGCGQVAVNYKLRDWLFSRQRYWGEPFPILHYEDGSKRVLGLDELPLVPPHITDYKPGKEGLSPLANAPEWVMVVDPVTGRTARREINTMPQWAGSCWYYLRFIDPHNQQQAWSPEAERYWMNVDLYVGGAEHAVLHLLYARFWHKVLFDCGLVHTEEPFKTYRYQGLVLSRSYQKPSGAYVPEEEVEERDGAYFEKGTGLALRSQVEKMSKSKLNGVSPDELIEEFGADAVRLYSLFMGPFDREKVWSTDSVSGCRRFLNRVWELFAPERIQEQANPAASKIVHRLARDVGSDLQGMQFNTAVAKMMEALNNLVELQHLPKADAEMFALILAPFAPHLAEELWAQLGHPEGLAYAPWPKADPSLLVETTMDLIVQVCGKHRATLRVAKDLAEAEVRRLAQEDPGVARHLTGTIQKVIYVPGRLLNFVVT